MSAESYIQEMDSIAKELKRMNNRAKILREQKKAAQLRLYNYMKSNKIDRYGDITIQSITPKPKKTRKPKSQQKEEAIVLFSQAGARNPEELYQHFLSIRKGDDEKVQNGYNSFLGF